MTDSKEDRAIVDWDLARQETIDKLTAQRDKLIEALREYANPAFWDALDNVQDFGDIARAALAAVTE